MQSTHNVKNFSKNNYKYMLYLELNSFIVNVGASAIGRNTRSILSPMKKLFLMNLTKRYHIKYKPDYRDISFHIFACGHTFLRGKEHTTFQFWISIASSIFHYYTIMINY